MYFYNNKINTCDITLNDEFINCNKMCLIPGTMSNNFITEFDTLFNPVFLLIYIFANIMW